ncbi:MAG: DNA primase [Sphingomonadales bacterium]
MAYPNDFLDELRARTSLEAVISRKVKLTKKGREHSGLCPFHNEKTPSFTVVEEKGFYHCFGCGAHGDVIRFVMEDEGLPFHEAVQKLAADVGLPLPEFSKADLEAEKKRNSLYEIMEKAANWYISRLNSEEGKGAREYLKGRGLSQDTTQRFSLGFAPGRYTALKEAMMSRGIKEEELLACGLLSQKEGKDSIDKFRNRLMFPILDVRGRTIAFSGRALDDAPAKYMNSPETKLFHKGSVIYNLGGARKSAFDSGEILVVEGQMDVIALAEFGFENTVAPLGTAVTENQLHLLWRIVDEPTFCFDGDPAGFKAALRAMERALPLLQPGKSLQFALLPRGDDPDTLVRREGKESFANLLRKSLSLADLLWRQLTEKALVKTPEQRAGLEKVVFTKLSEIKNEKLKSYYRSDFGKRLNRLFRKQYAPKGSIKGKFTGTRNAVRPSGLLQTQIGRAQGDEAVATFLEEVILLSVLNHPKLAVDHFEDLSAIPFKDQDLGALQKSILDFAHDPKTPDINNLKDHLLKSGLETFYRRLHEKSTARNVKFARPETSFEMAEKWWHKTLERLMQISALKKDYEDLEQDYLENPSEQKWHRLTAIKTEINKSILNDEFLRDYDLDSMAGSTI